MDRSSMFCRPVRAAARVATAALIALCAFAAPAQAQKQGGSITVGLELDVLGFDPLKVGVYDTSANMVAAAVFDTLTSRGVDVSGLVISSRAHIVMPYHKDEDGFREEVLKNAGSQRPVGSGEGQTEIGTTKLKHIQDLCPDIDMVGVNAYGGAATLPQRYRELGGAKPYLLTEYGPGGHWESPKADWGASLEPTSTEKARASPHLACATSWLASAARSSASVGAPCAVPNGVLPSRPMTL